MHMHRGLPCKGAGRLAVGPWTASLRQQRGIEAIEIEGGQSLKQDMPDVVDRGFSLPVVALQGCWREIATLAMMCQPAAEIAG